MLQWRWRSIVPWANLNKKKERKYQEAWNTGGFADSFARVKPKEKRKFHRIVPVVSLIVL